MKHNSDRKLVALNNGAGNVSTAYLDLGPGGGTHIPNGRFVWSLPLQDSLANAGTVACELTHSDVPGSGYTTVPGYGNMIVTGGGGVGAAAQDFSMPIAKHVKQYVKARFTQVGTGDNSDVSAEFYIEL